LCAKIDTRFSSLFGAVSQISTTASGPDSFPDSDSESDSDSGATMWCCYKSISIKANVEAQERKEKAAPRKKGKHFTYCYPGHINKTGKQQQQHTHTHIHHCTSHC